MHPLPTALLGRTADFPSLDHEGDGDGERGWYEIGGRESPDTIYARRALQLRLKALRPALGDAAAFAARLNQPVRDQMAAMWEVAVLHELTTLERFGMRCR